MTNEGFTMTATREIYWLSKQPSKWVQEKIQLLQKYGVKARLLQDFEALTRAYAESRLSTIVIGDEAADESLIPNMQKLSNHPEFAGVRLILSLSQANGLLVDYAANLGFRDIIAVDLPNETWIRRYVFASSGKPTDLKDPHPQITARSMASIRVPARISWMTEKELWLETRLNPPVGSTLALGGGIADFLGVKQIGIKVKEYHKTNLHFRYSEAMLCAWDIPKSLQERKSVLKEFFKAQKFTPPYRFYAVVRNHDLRKSIVKNLNPNRFEVTVALNKNNMIHEPRFISPDAVLIEDRLCVGSYQENFLSMLQNVDPTTPIVVLGHGAIPEIPTHRVLRLPVLPLNLEGYFEKELGSPKQIRPDLMPIAKNHALSFAQVIMSGRLAQVHPEAIEIALAHPLGRFGIFSVDAPLFQQTVGHPVHCKVVRHAESKLSTGWKEYPHHAQAIVVDLNHKQRLAVSDRLIQVVSEQLGLVDKPAPAAKAVNNEVVWAAKEPVKAEEPAHFEELIPTVPKGKSMPAPAEAPVIVDAVPIAAPAAMGSLAINIDVGPGPMRTELARPLNGPSAQDDVLPATEIIPLRHEMRIPTTEDAITTHPLDRIVEDLSRIPREWKYIFWSVVAMAILIAAAYFFRIPQQDQAPLFTEQLKIYQKEHGGEKKPASDSDSDDDTPGVNFWK